MDSDAVGNVIFEKNEIVKESKKKKWQFVGKLDLEFFD